MKSTNTNGAARGSECDVASRTAETNGGVFKRWHVITVPYIGNPCQEMNGGMFDHDLLFIVIYDHHSYQLGCLTKEEQQFDDQREMYAREAYSL